MKLLSIVLLSLALVSLISTAFAYSYGDWDINPSWTVSPSWNAYVGPDTYTLTASFTTPTNTTYTNVTSVGWSISASGNETGVTYQIALLNGSTPVGSNQTNPTGTWVNLVNGTYKACVSALGSHGATDYKTVMFTVQYIVGYTLSVSFVTPVNTTYASSAISWSISTSGNDTGVTTQVMLKASNGTTIGSNGTSSSGSWIGLTNSGYTAYVSAYGSHSTFASQNVNFTVTMAADTYIITAIISTPQNTTYYTSSVNYSVTTGGNDTALSYQIQCVCFNGTNIWASNQTSATGTMTGITVNGTYTFGAIAIGTHGSTAYAEVQFTVTILIAAPHGLSDIVTTDPFALNFTTGTAFAVEDPYRFTTLTFTVTVGNFTGIGILSVTVAEGQLEVTMTSECAITITDYSATTLVYVNGAIYMRGNQLVLHNGLTVTIVWRNLGSIVQGTGNVLNLYFRSDTYTTLGVTALGMDTDYTNLYTSANISAAGTTQIDYGFRAWLVRSNISSSELTDGSPQAIISLDSNTTGYTTAEYTFGGATVTLGYQALEIIVYARESGGDWVAQAQYISNVLITKQLVASVWTFRLYVDYHTSASTTTSAFIFGASSYRSGIYNIIYTQPLPSEIAWWRLMRGDLIGFIIGAYFDQMGVSFYVLILFAFCGSLYRRYGHIGPVAVMFVMFAGPGGLLLILLPGYAVIPAATFLIIGCVFILWRLIR